MTSAGLPQCAWVPQRCYPRNTMEDFRIQVENRAAFADITYTKASPACFCPRLGAEVGSCERTESLCGCGNRLGCAWRLRHFP